MQVTGNDSPSLSSTGEASPDDWCLVLNFAFQDEDKQKSNGEATKMRSTKHEIRGKVERIWIIWSRED